MSVILDIISSVIIGGIIMVIIIGIIANLSQSSYEKYESTRSESNRIALARQIEFDLEKIGFHATKPAILAADSNSIWFNADLYKDKVVRGVRYYLGSPTETLVSKTKNPRDRVFYREESGKATTVYNYGVTNLRFTYYDSTGAATTNRVVVKAIEITVDIETTEPHNSVYQSFTWQKRFYPLNL